LLKTLTKYRF